MRYLWPHWALNTEGIADAVVRQCHVTTWGYSTRDRIAAFERRLADPEEIAELIDSVISVRVRQAWAPMTYELGKPH